MTGMRGVWGIGVAVALVAGTAGAELDPERNHLACWTVKGKSFRRTVVVDVG